MARTLSWIGLAAIVFVTGCVPRDQYNALKMERDSIAEQLGKANEDAAAATRESALLKKNVADMAALGGVSQATLTNLTQQLTQAQLSAEDWHRKYEDAVKNGRGGGFLKPELSEALKQFAAQNPDLVEFEPSMGMLKFKSDFTFASGSAELKPEARAALDKLATILNSSAASGCELMVAGHTDNMPVQHEATIAAGHKDNWYLSSHRAIVVAKELISQRVNAARIGAAGYADQRPIASNASAAGQAKNRRVEVLILPGEGSFAPGTGGPAPKEHLQKDSIIKPKGSGPNKDTPVTHPPTINK